MKAIKKLLIIRLSALGDVAMTLPAIYSLAEAHPGLRLTVLTTPRFASLFVGAPANVAFIGYDHKACGTVSGFLRLMRRLRGEHFDAVADLHNVLRSWLIDACFLLTFHRVVMLDKRRRQRRALTTGSGAPAMTAQPFTERYFDLFRRLGFNLADTFGGLFANGRKAAPTAPFQVGIAPFARYQSKTYPLDQMERVVAQLSLRGDVEVTLFGGGPREAACFREWTSRYQRMGTRVGELSLAEELQLMSGLDVMVSMDSANQHLAALCGVPVITLWGGTTPACGFTPWRQPAHRSLSAGVPCQPCTVAGSDKCRMGDFRCMTQLTPETVVRAVERELGT